MPTNQSSPWGGGKLCGADITTTTSAAAAAAKTSAVAKVPFGVQASLELSRQKDQAKALPASSAAPQRQRAVALSGASVWENGDGCKTNAKSPFTAVPHGCPALPQPRNGTGASSIYKREWQVGVNGVMPGVAQKWSLIQSSSPETAPAVIRRQASSNEAAPGSEPTLLSVGHQDLFVQGQSPVIHHKSTLEPADSSTSSPPVPTPRCLTLSEQQGAAQGNDASTRDRTRSTARETTTTTTTTGRCHSAKLAAKPSPTQNGCTVTLQSHGRVAPPAGLAKTADKKPQSVSSHAPPEVGPFPNGPMPTVPSASASATQGLPATPPDPTTGATSSPVVSAVATQISEIHLTRKGQPVSTSPSPPSSSSSPAEENGVKESQLSGTESVMQVDGFEEELTEEQENVCSDDDESEYSSINGSSPSASIAVLSGIEEPMSLGEVEAGEERPALVPSLFPLIPPTLYFSYANEKVEMLPAEQRRLLKWKMSTVTPNVVRHIIARSHFKITKKNHDWMGCWGHHMKSCGFRVLEAHQKLNHFPGTFQIGRKDRLWRNLSKMQVHFGKREFSFFPRTFILPQDIKLLRKAWDDGAHRQKWIIKPPASARGTGIQVIHKWSQMPRKRPLLVQKYLHKPYLIGGSKFDLRIYAYVTCYDPLRIYIFNDGLVRFASCKYSSSMKTLGNKFMHLTNYSVNKKNSEYQTNSDDKACQGHKWALKALWQYLGVQDVNTTQIWEKIKDIVVKTIIASEPYVTNLLRLHLKSPYSCHELFGFDIMLDEKLKPWILEVNISPSLHSSSALDVSIKGQMIRDLLNLAGFRIPLKAEVTTPCSSASSSTSSLYGSMVKEKAKPDLSADEKVKRAFYVGQSFTDQDLVSSMLDVLTPEDVRVLAESEDELSRQGEFERIFPSPSSSRYLRFFEAPRYLNMLLDRWEQRYWNDRTKGISLLQTLCEKGVHQGTTDPAHIWSKCNYVPKFGTNKPDVNGASKSRVVVTYHRRLPSDDEDEDDGGAWDREVASASASSLPLSPSPCSSVTSSACASPQPGPAPSMLT